MTLALNGLLEEINSWKSLLRDKDEEIENLRKAVLHANKQNESLEAIRVSLLQEVAQFNSAVTSLQISVSRLEENEVEKKALEEEKNKLKLILEDREKQYQKQINEITKEIENLKIIQKEKTESNLKQALAEVSSKVDNYLKTIKEKDNHISKLEEELSSERREKKEEILKLQVEYEEKIGKVKAHLPRIKTPLKLYDGFKADDIFRQKYLKLERESKEESSILRKQIEELQLQIKNLRSKNNMPLNGLLQNSTQVDSSFTELLEKNEFIPQLKRLKTYNIQTDEKDSHFNMNAENNSNKSGTVRPQKKKLFNLDFNYFNKG